MRAYCTSIEDCICGMLKLNPMLTMHDAAYPSNGWFLFSAFSVGDDLFLKRRRCYFCTYLYVYVFELSCTYIHDSIASNMPTFLSRFLLRVLLLLALVVVILDVVLM